MDSTNRHLGVDERLEELIHDILANADPNIDRRADIRIKRELDTATSKFVIFLMLLVLGWVILRQIDCLLSWLSRLCVYKLRQLLA